MSHGHTLALFSKHKDMNVIWSWEALYVICPGNLSQWFLGRYNKDFLSQNDVFILVDPNVVATLAKQKKKKWMNDHAQK